jgi:catechol 2,3-dioxygenase-like lactoylglutathione lyase family enzyme
MNLFGRFLELSLPTTDIRESLDWYRLLGFTECPVGDIYEHHYAVVTDGRIYIGLHGANADETSLTFVRPELSQNLQALQAVGLAVDEIYKGEERFHQLVLHDPSGLRVRLIEARTFSPAHIEQPPVVGQLRNLCLTTPYPEDAATFWERGGFDVHDSDDGNIELLMPGMTLLLMAGRATPCLNFHCTDQQSLLDLLNLEDLRYKQRGNELELISPEGLPLRISS